MPIAATTSTLATAASSAPVGAIMHQFDQHLRTAGYDLKSLIKSIDLHSVGFFTLLVIACIFLFDLLNYGYATYLGNTSTYSSYGRSLVSNAARVWDQRDELGFNSIARGSRGLDTMTDILDSLSDAIIKYEHQQEDNTIQSSRQSKDVQFQ